ncbi:hypothetical protein BJ998_007754 [Kutzneria kofuensis]|uniref:Uncharacterized protein n=1 Tax=Kutzneria kofuensis TaxID=103725 RepID=A0A7W9NLQ2_9PSEU|nr:hypothetical protein [Kutzneria kofuensis]
MWWLDTPSAAGKSRNCLRSWPLVLAAFATTDPGGVAMVREAVARSLIDQVDRASAMWTRRNSSSSISTTWISWSARPATGTRSPNESQSGYPLCRPAATSSLLSSPGRRRNTTSTTRSTSIPTTVGAWPPSRGTSVNAHPCTDTRPGRRRHLLGCRTRVPLRQTHGGRDGQTLQAGQGTGVGARTRGCPVAQRLCPHRTSGLRPLAEVVDVPSEDGVAVVGLTLVENCFQPGQHGRALSGREVGANHSLNLCKPM